MANQVELTEKQFLTIIDLATHLVLALILAGFFRWLTGGWMWPILGVIGGILIDLDHFIDYFLYYGFKINLGDFFNHRYLASGKCRIFFHSWEVIILLWVFSLRFFWITPIAAGMTLHIITDWFFNSRSDLIYLSLIYRWRHKFNVDKIFPDEFVAGKKPFSK